MIKLFVSDIDGTIYDHNTGSISDKTKAAIISLQENKIPVCLATARGARGVEEIATLLKLDQYGGYIVASNGAHVYDFQHKQTIDEQFIELSVLHELYDFGQLWGLNFNVEQEEMIVTTGYDQGMEEDRIHVKLDFLVVGKDFFKHIKTPVYKCAFSKTPEKLDEIIELANKQFSDRLYLCRSGAEYLDIVNKDVNKASGIEKLVTHEGIKMDEVAAIGDGENDCWMLQYAGLSACVEEGSKRAKETANVIVSSCIEGGVADFIENHVLPQIKGI